MTSIDKKKLRKVAVVMLVAVLAVSIASLFIKFDVPVVYATKNFGMEDTPVLPDVTVIEDSEFITVDNGLFIFKFRVGTGGYNEIWEGESVLVQNERWVLERLFKTPDDYRQSGYAVRVSYEQLSSKAVKVTRFFEDVAFGNYYNITYTFQSMCNVKIAVEGLIGTGFNYRLVWDVSGVSRSTSERVGYEVLLSEAGQQTVTLDYSDVYYSRGDVTSYELSEWSSNRKATEYFNIGYLNSGTTFILDPTFGYTGIGGAAQQVTDYIRGSSFTMPERGNVTSITAALGYADVEMGEYAYVKAAVYLDTEIGPLQGNTTETYAEIEYYSFDWVTMTFAQPLTLNASTDYYLVVWASDTDSGYDVGLAYSSGDTNQGHYDSEAYGGNWLSIIGASPFDNYKYSVYATYTAIGEEDTENPTYSLVNHNTTEAGESIRFYGYFDDNIALSKYIFSTNNTGSWSNDTALSFSATPSWANVSKTLNSTEGSVVQYRYYWNDTSNNWGSMSVQSLTVTSTDTTPPTYSLVGHTTVVNGSSCDFYGYFNDNVELSHFIFSTNNTESWVNDTAVAFSSTPGWGNATKTLHATEGTTVQYRYYWNDTSNNWASMTIQSLITDTAEYDVSVSASPEINVQFQIDGYAYSTPTTQPLGETTHSFTASAGKVYGGLSFGFNRWLVNGSDTYYTLTINLDISGDTTIVAYYESAVGYYTFIGPIDEETGLELEENVTVTVNYMTEEVPLETFDFNGTAEFSPSGTVQFFQFNFTDAEARQYWVDPSETVTDIYVIKGNDTTTYVINFMDTSGILSDYPYVSVQRYINGSLYTVEKRKVDVYNSILVNLIYGRTYQITLGNEDTTYVFGDLTMTSTTGIQLVLRSIDIPIDTAEDLIMYRYVRIYATRNGSIIIYYDDTRENTDSVDITIYTLSGSSVYSTTVYTDSFDLEWGNADNETGYYVEATINHGDYGAVDWRQTFPAIADMEPPFGLEFLGDWGFDSYMLVPALLCLCVAGCFSKLNAYVGAILMMIVAVALAWMGWFPVPASMLVTGFMLAVLMALVWHKRGVLT